MDVLKSLWADARPWLLGLLFGWVLGACLCSCSTARRLLPPPANHAAEAELPMSLGVPVDSLIPQKPTPEVVQKSPGLGIFSRKKPHSSMGGQIKAGAETHTNATYLPRKCKGCTFNTVLGNQTNAAKKAQAATGTGAALTVAGKKAGPIIKADSAASVQVASSKAGPAQAGHDNTATTVAKRGLLAGLLHWLPWGLGIAAVGAAAWFGLPVVWPLLLAAFRRKKSTDTTA